MSLLLLFHGSPPAGPVSGNLVVAEANDILSASGTLPLNGALATTEADDVGTASGVAAIAASTFTTEADDTGVATATLSLAASLSLSEGSDFPSAGGMVGIVGSLAGVEQDDAIAVQGALGNAGTLAIAEQDDTLAASALVPVWYPRRGDDDRWSEYERRQVEWQDQLRWIIDRSWQVAHGEIDPITFETIPPPDYSAVIGKLINQAITLDQARVEAFVVEQKRLQEEEAISILLLAA